ncbi:MAG: hypothetical protein FWC62_06540 [Firmicutes bacterium]|nr:hypothetical protein [Bacillota bacterium]
MMYLSKGIPLWRPTGEAVSVSHCGALHKLAGIQAELWLAGQFHPAYARSPEQGAALEQLVGLGIVVTCNETDTVALFRLLTNCTICPIRIKKRPALLSYMEHRLLRWIRHAGLRLTIAELTLLNERDVRPVPSLLGEENRQTLTESIYTTETIRDGILETLMEKSPARDDTVQAVLGLLRKRKIFLV